MELAGTTILPAVAAAAHRIAPHFTELKRQASKRPKKRDRTKEANEFMAMAAALPIPTASICTDDSATPNPGPSGAGFLILPHDKRSSETCVRTSTTPQVLGMEPTTRLSSMQRLHAAVNQMINDTPQKDHLCF